MTAKEFYKQLRERFSQWYFSKYIPLMIEEGITDSNWKSDLKQLKIVEELLLTIWVDTSHVDVRTKFYDALWWCKYISYNKWKKLNKKEG